jgi:uncharacterized membrane protein YraQ (UPF0718 family)
MNAVPGKRGTVELSNPPLDERLIAALKFGGYLAKQILPYFTVGLIVVGYVTAYMPESIVEGYALTAWSCSVIFSLVYGILTGSL